MIITGELNLTSLFISIFTIIISGVNALYENDLNYCFIYFETVIIINNNNFKIKIEVISIVSFNNSDCT
jgi:hypothetical protein